MLMPCPGYCKDTTNSFYHNPTSSRQEKVNFNLIVTQACVIAASEVLMAASSIFKTKRQEAKAAADAAAAAAADACAVCEKLYGDDPEKDDLWIACDRCNRWYHGACVDLTQVIVITTIIIIIVTIIIIINNNNNNNNKNNNNNNSIAFQLMMS